MRIRLIRHWTSGVPGDILPDVGAGVAEQLISRGIAVEDVPDAELETSGAGCAPERDKAIKPARVKRKGGGQ